MFKRLGRQSHTCSTVELVTIRAFAHLVANIAARALSFAMLLSGSAHAQSAAPKNIPALEQLPARGYDYANPEVQPVFEALDLDMYSRIRNEGFERSQIMRYASTLFDGIGPRLTGSPNMAKANAWTREQLAAMGCSDAHLEGWGDFGMGWRQIGTSVEMVAPDTAVFIAQATPWSPPTSGAVTASVIAVSWPKDEKDFAQWKGKLTGKIILLGQTPAIHPDAAPLLQHFENDSLQEIYNYPLDGSKQKQNVQSDGREEWAEIFKQINFQEKIARFLAAEHAVAILRSSYAGDGGVIRDDNNEAMGERVYLPDHRQPIPSVVLANENFGRISRLLENHVSVTLTIRVNTEFTGDHAQGYNTVAEIPGTDPLLKNQIVIFGGHLDSWIAGTGATDDGAGAIIAIEAMRILTALQIKPRRTIRIALWSGEEEGRLGSLAYVRNHFATIGLSTKPEQLDVPEFLRQAVGPLELKPEQALVSAYFNLDNGGGKLLGIYSENNAAIVPVFQQWIAPLRDLGVTTVTMRRTEGTDHQSFDEVGIPGFQFIQDPRDYETRSKHTNQDVYERLSPADLKQAAVVEAIFVYNAAMRQQMLPRKPLPHPEVSRSRGNPLGDTVGRDEVLKEK